MTFCLNDNDPRKNQPKTGERKNKHRMMHRKTESHVTFEKPIEKFRNDTRDTRVNNDHKKRMFWSIPRRNRFESNYENDWRRQSETNSREYSDNSYISNSRQERRITSYGIILFTSVNSNNKLADDNEFRYQLCQRRDSIAYAEFLKNNLTPENMSMYINMMSKEERQRCIDFIDDPDSLWNDLWVNHKTKIYKNDQPKCCEAFRKNIRLYIEEFKNPTYKENPWGFSKGRKHSNETPQECALREFEEETTISSSKIQLLNIDPYEENYTGTDGRLYKTIYYVAYISYIPELEEKKSCTVIERTYISEEISKIKWLPFNEILPMIDSMKQEILTNINKMLISRRKKTPPRRITY